MAIQYYLQPNPVTPDPNDQIARVAANTTLNMEVLIQKIMRRGTLVTETDARAVLNVFFDVVSDEVADGNNVTLPLVNIRPGISGVFSSATDTFDNRRHTKKATISAGTLLNKKIADSAIEKITSPIPSPSLLEFTDVNSQTTNTRITPGGIGQLIGESLKFNPENSGEGVFLISEANTEIKIEVIANRTEGKLVFAFPATIEPGTYLLQVRKGYGKNGSIRTGELTDNLIVS